MLLVSVAFGQLEREETETEKQRREQIQRSLQVLNQALLLDSTNHYLYELKALTEISLGLLEEAQQSFDMADSLYPEDPAEDGYGSGYNDETVEDNDDYGISRPKFPGGEDALNQYLSSAGLPKNYAQYKDTTVTVMAVITTYGNAYVDMSNAKNRLDSLAFDHVYRMPLWQPASYDTITLEITFTKVLDEPRPITLPPGMEPDTVAQFIGGTDELMEYTKAVIRYPVVARENDIEGTVYVSFIVDETGRVGNVQIARGVDKYLDKESLRVVNLMPPFFPAIKGGLPVASEFVIPIKFMLH